MNAMIITTIILFLLWALTGYVIGRWGDNYINFWMQGRNWFNYLPDHWIYGLLLMIVSLFIFHSWWFYVFAFGLGHFISDLKDFLHLKFYGSDNKSKSERRFWHID